MFEPPNPHPNWRATELIESGINYICLWDGDRLVVRMSAGSFNDGDCNNALDNYSMSQSLREKIEGLKKDYLALMAGPKTKRRRIESDRLPRRR